MADAVRRWAEALAAWAIPEHITAAVTDSPWLTPVDLFARRADQAVARPTGPSWHRAAQALAPEGAVLDVGAGAGAASLPLAAHTTQLTAVDTNSSMLDALAARASTLGVPVRTIEGRWPDVSGDAPTADVVVCHHVVYNVPDLDAFARALTGRARRRVVVELTAGHPMRALNPLWKLMHGLDRPERPTAADAVAVLREAGIDPHEERWPRRPRLPYPSLPDLVAVTRQRLCLPPERSEELASALVDLGVDPASPRDLSPADDELVTLWWDRDT